MTVLKIQPAHPDGYDGTITEANPNVNNYMAASVWVAGISPNRWQALILFSLSSLPVGATITKAEFCVYCLGLSGKARVRCSEASQVWDQLTVTWNTRPVPGMTQIEGIPALNTWTKFDVKSILQDWIENPLYNNGFQLVADLCEISEMYFASSWYDVDITKRPYLEITYTYSGAAPSPPAPHGSTHTETAGDPVPNATDAEGGLESAADKTKLDGIEAGADVTDATNIATAIVGTPETSPIATDEYTFVQTATGLLKKVLSSTLTALLKAYFDTLYAVSAGEGHITALCYNWFSQPQGTWVVTQGGTQVAHTIYNSSGAQNDEITYNMYLAAGTYTCRVLGIQNTDAPRYKVSGYNGADTFDFLFYGALTYNKVLSQTGLVIATSGLKTISIKAVTSDHGGYVMYLSTICFFRTA
jgi:hypothetical protein